MATQQQMLQQQALAMVAGMMEAKLDAEIDRLDNLGEADIESIRKHRVADMKRKQEKSKEWLAKGHGSYEEIADEKAFFSAMKGEERVICHFYMDTSVPCKVMDRHLEILAKKHIETKFVKINAEKSPFLTERLKIWMLPTLALIKHEKVEDYVVGFDQLGGTDDFETDALAERLSKGEMIDYNAPTWIGQSKKAESKKVRKGGFQRTDSDEDSDFEG